MTENTNHYRALESRTTEFANGIENCLEMRYWILEIDCKL